MKLLMLTPQRPFPTHQGTTIRNFHLIKELSKRHQVWLITFLEPDQPADHGPLTDLCALVETVPVPVRDTAKRLSQLAFTRRPDMAWRLWSPQFDKVLRQRLAETAFDVIQIEGIEMVPYLPTIKRHAKQAKIIFDDHNAEWLLQARNFQTDSANPRRIIPAAYSYIQTKRLKRYERSVCQNVDHVVVCSEADQTAILTLDPSLDIAVIPNGVDLGAYGNYCGETIPFDILFTGKMDYRPNIDAMLWFGLEVMPKILLQRPGTTLGIVGQRPHPRLDVLKANPFITITGFVDDILPYISGAKVYVTPFRIGGGTRLKVLEAMAMRRPIVSTALGVEGYPIEPQRDVLVIDEDSMMATVITQLLIDDKQRQSLGERAYQFVEANYAWERIVPQMEALYTS